MSLPNIVFDENTDYDAVSLMLTLESTDIVSNSCSCSGNVDKGLLIFNKFMKASVINAGIPNIPRYKNNIQSAYYELKKLNC